VSAPPELVAHITPGPQPGPMVVEAVEICASHLTVRWRADGQRTPSLPEPGDGIEQTPIILSDDRGTDTSIGTGTRHSPRGKRAVGRGTCRHHPSAPC
jgi:hypothetical protein